MMPWADSVRALLVSWYPGVEGGNALADVLTGVAEPGGRLPFAIPSDADHLVPFDKDATAVVYDLLHGQWKLDADGHTAHFPFGAGTGYTTFTDRRRGGHRRWRHTSCRSRSPTPATGPDRPSCSRSAGSRAPTWCARFVA